MCRRSDSARPDPFASLPDPHEGFALRAFLDTVRKQLILRALEIASGNQSEAARLLGITMQAVSRFRAGQAQD